jgi:hypothetical protein
MILDIAEELGSCLGMVLGMRDRLYIECLVGLRVLFVLDLAGLGSYLLKG